MKGHGVRDLAMAKDDLYSLMGPVMVVSGVMIRRRGRDRLGMRRQSQGITANI
jgi:hypothetical protein